MLFNKGRNQVTGKLCELVSVKNPVRFFIFETESHSVAQADQDYRHEPLCQALDLRHELLSASFQI